jgi:uncharacterized membrane protein
VRWRPIDIIVLIIIASISFALAAFMLRPYITGTENPPQTIEVAAELFGALIAIVAVYVGSSLEKIIFKKSDNDENDTIDGQF